MSILLRFALIFVLVVKVAASNSTVVGHYMDEVVTVENHSESGKTIVVDRGRHHGYKPDDYGILLIRADYPDPETGETRKVFKPVAKLKLAKLFNTSSVWVSLRSYLPEYIKVGVKLVLLPESKLLTGRANLNIKTTKTVGHKRDLVETVKANLKDDGMDLAKKAKDYHVGERVHEKETHFDKDIEMIDVDAWEDVANRGKLSQTAIYRSPHAKSFSDRKRVATFEKMAYEFLRRYNDPKFTLKYMYFNDEDVENVDPDTVRAKSLFENAFDSYAYAEAKRLQREKKLAEDLRSKGETWSDGYSNEELSELLYNVNAINEIERRREIQSFHFDYQLYLGMGINLQNNDANADNEDKQDSKFDVELAAEGYFFKRIRALKNFTFELALRRNQDSFDSGDANVVTREFSGSLHLNYYPFYQPNILERNILYVGLMTRYGLADLEIPSAGEEGNYTVQTLPGFRGGIKYNFKGGIGLRLLLGLENIAYERIVRNYRGGDLPDRANYLEYKLSVGLSKFF